MATFRRTVVTALLSARPGLQRMQTELGPAYALTDLVGPVAPGDPVVLNTTAVEHGLGTGGWHVVHWNLARDGWESPGGGHIVKLRYTSLQADTGAAEEDGDAVPADLDGMVVVGCSLHSQVPCVAAAVRARRPAARIVYVMTDGGALPAVLSDLVAAQRDRGLVDATITAGHAFGGDLESVSVPSALALAKHRCRADVCIVGMGPGVVGTASPLGTTAVEVAAALDATAALRGRPVICVRASDADPRERHGGVSHHTRTILRLVRSRCFVPLPPGVELDAPDHDVVVVEDGPDVGRLLAELGLEVTTMGRSPADDPLFFASCGVAGTFAAALLGDTRPV